MGNSRENGAIVISDTIESKLEKTIEKSEKLLEGFKTINHSIQENKALWEKRVAYAQNIKARLDKSQHATADMLIQQAQGYVDYFDRNGNIQKDKIDALTVELNKLNVGLQSIKKTNREETLQANISTLSPLEPMAHSQKVVKSDKYRKVQEEMMTANALIELNTPQQTGYKNHE